MQNLRIKWSECWGFMVGRIYASKSVIYLRRVLRNRIVEKFGMCRWLIDAIKGLHFVTETAERVPRD